MTAQLRTRKPTGKVPYPLVLLAGAEKSGKSYSAFVLASSPKVGRTFVFDIGEGGADEYAELGGYEIVEHDGTYADIAEQVEAACALPDTDGRPNVIIIDSATNLWELLKDEATKTAKSRGKTDPTMDLWNKAKDRWRRIVDQLIRYPGIAVITARAGDVAEVVDGVPVKGGSMWKVQAEKNLPYDANVIIKTTGPGQAEIVGARSLHLHVPAGRTLPVPGFTLEKVVFDLLKADGGVRDLKVVSADMVPVKHAKVLLVDAFRQAGYSYDGQSKKGEAVDRAAALWGKRGNNAISSTELDQLLASIASIAADEAPFDEEPAAQPVAGENIGEESAPASVPEAASAEPSTRDDTDPTGSADSAPAVISDVEARRLHRDLGRQVDKGGYGISDSADHEHLIFCCSNGRTVHASELTVHELAAVYQWAENVRAGRVTIDDVRSTAENHRHQMDAVADFDARTQVGASA